jgi:hypothetical protein
MRSRSVQLFGDRKDHAGNADQRTRPVHRLEVLVEHRGGEQGDEQRARTGEQCAEPGRHAVLERQEDAAEPGRL